LTYKTQISAAYFLEYKRSRIYIMKFVIRESYRQAYDVCISLNEYRFTRIRMQSKTQTASLVRWFYGRSDATLRSWCLGLDVKAAVMVAADKSFVEPAVYQHATPW